MALLILGADVDFDCRRVRFDYHVQPCELKRGKREVLDAAGRPAMRKLGDGAFRFSTSPALGGRAGIVEIVPRPEGGADVRAFAFEGHPQRGWTRTGSAGFRLPANEQRRLLSELDAALPPYRRSSGDIDGPVMIVCTDGPGYLTERIRGRAVETLAGSCPLDDDAPHPNAIVACRLDELLRRHLREADRPDTADSALPRPPISTWGCWSRRSGSRWTDSTSRPPRKRRPSTGSGRTDGAGCEQIRSG